MAPASPFRAPRAATDARISSSVSFRSVVAAAAFGIKLFLCY
jgi:hypothetical protein